GHSHFGSCARYLARPSRALAHTDALPGLACLASLAGSHVHDLRVDVDIQWLAFNGPRPAIFHGQGRSIGSGVTWRRCRVENTVDEGEPAAVAGARGRMVCLR